MSLAYRTIWEGYICVEVGDTQTLNWHLKRSARWVNFRHHVDVDNYGKGPGLKSSIGRWYGGENATAEEFAVINVWHRTTRWRGI